MWKFSKDGDFSVKSAYQVVRQEENNGKSFQGSWIWKLDTLPKIVHFLWLSCHGSIPVHGVLAARGINCDKCYPLCKCSEETIPHLLRDCNLTSDFWRKLEPPPALINTFNDNFQVRWNKPPEGWFKLNTDGASCGNPGKAGGGGIIKNSHGHWIKGYSGSIGYTTSVIAKWWALRDGLTLAIQLGSQQLEVELDAKVIAELLKSNSIANRGYSPLLHDCRLLLDRLQQLPCSVFFSTTLVTLKLVGNISLNPPSNSRFPCLRILRLAAFKYKNSDSLSTILTAYHVLQDFSLYVSLDENKGVFKTSTSLYKYPRSNYCIYGAFILALKYLIFMGQLIEDVLLENLLDLVELVIQLGIANGVNIEDNIKRIWDLLRPLTYVKSLGLTTKTTKIPYHAFGYEALLCTDH
nr:putative ribonuclease h protein [Quercus suber]